MNPDVRRQAIARAAKAIVALAFRNGPIERSMRVAPVPLALAAKDIPESRTLK